MKSQLNYQGFDLMLRPFAKPSCRPADVASGA
jgi:hypothetical protein